MYGSRDRTSASADYASKFHFSHAVPAHRHKEFNRLFFVLSSKAYDYLLRDLFATSTDYVWFSLSFLSSLRAIFVNVQVTPLEEEIVSDIKVG